MNSLVRRTFAAALLVIYGSAAFAANDWSATDYDLYPGDFDGDGKADLLYVARDPSRPSGIARSDGSGPNIPHQSWPSDYLGIPWYGNEYNVVVADFNNDDRADIFLQRKTAGDHFLLLANSQGKITGISQTVSNSSLGVVWAGTDHRIVAGDFNGDGYGDLFLQAVKRDGLNAVLLATATQDANGGKFQSNPTQSWTDSPSPGGFKWSTADALVYAGDFNGDGRSDLLVHARVTWTSINVDDISVPVPVYAPNMNGVVLAQGSGTLFSSASMKA